MPTESDVYALDATQAKDAYRQLADLAAALSTNTQALAAQNTLAATALEQAAAAAKRDEERLKENREETARLKEEKQKFSSMLKEDLSHALLSTAAQYEILKGVVHGVIDVVKESVKVAAEEEKANIRLANALKTAGYEGTAMLTHLSEMAEGFEQATNVSGETVKSIQELLIEFNVAPKRIEGLTQAILDYSAATGKDATTAAKELIGAIRGESDSVGKLKLDLTDMNGEADRTDAVISEIAKTMGGQALTAAQGYAGEMASVHTNIENAEKALGRLVLGLEKSTGLLKAESEGLQGLVYLFSEEHDAELAANKRTSALTANLAEITRIKDLLAKSGDRLFEFDKRQQESTLVNLEKQRVALLAVRDAANKATTAQDGSLESKGPGESFKLEETDIESDLPRRRKAAEDARKQLLADADRWDTRMQAMQSEELSKSSTREKAKLSELEAGLKERNQKIEEGAKTELEIEQHKTEAVRRAALRAGESPGELAARLETRLAALQENAAREVAAEDALQEQLARTDNADLQARLRERLEALKKGAKAELEVERKLGEDIETLHAQQAKQDAKLRAEMVGTVVNAVNQVLAAELSTFIQSATANQAYTEGLRARSIERRQIELAEQGVTATRGGVEAEMAQEAEAADKKRLASTLATIAQAAALQALAMGAKAVERAVEYDYAGAAQAGVAAGLYTALAVAAGGAAAAVNNARGMTTDERQSLDAFDKRKTAAAATRESKQSGGVAGGAASAAPTVTIYNLGITGQTRTAQGRELEKLQREYGGGRVGGRGF